MIVLNIFAIVIPIIGKEDLIMAIGERIRYFRNLRGMTMKRLGVLLGYSERTADVRVAQYENGSRAPKKELVEKLAETLDVTPEALNVPDIDTYTGLAHTLFALEDIYGLKIGEIDGEICIRQDRQIGQAYISLYSILRDWNEIRKQYESGEITKEEYDQWRYKYPHSILKEFKYENK